MECPQPNGYIKQVNKSGYFHGGINSNFNLIKCEENIVIQLILQRYILNQYPAYIICLEMERTQAMIHQHLQWTGIRESVQKTVSNCDTCQCKKRRNKNMVNYQIKYLKKYYVINYVQILKTDYVICIKENKVKLNLVFNMINRYHYRLVQNIGIQG